MNTIKSRSTANILTTYNKFNNTLKARSLKPLLSIFDNECSTSLNDVFHKNILTLQLMTPYNHFHNTTERAIGIIKDHFIAGLESLDPTFPMRLCCHLAPQAVQSLNLMLDSRINPHFSSETQINGALDF